MTTSHSNQNDWITKRSRYGFIAFIILIAIFCEIYSHKLDQNNQFQSPSSATSTFAEPTAPPTVADAVAPATAHIDSIMPATGTVDTMIEVSGENFSGFGGDLTLWIQNDAGQKGIIYASNRTSGASTTPNLIQATIPVMACSTDTSYSGAACPSGILIIPGTYEIFTAPWSKQSNSLQFTVVGK